MLLADSTQIRAADQHMIQGLGFPGFVLMEHAGRQLADAILTHFPRMQRCLVLAGPGNNGGDGFVAARHLRLAGWEVAIQCTQPPHAYQGDAATALQCLSGSGIPLHTWPDAPAWDHDAPHVLLDALLGTGVQSALRGPVKELIERHRHTAMPVVAVDLPSGLDASSGTLPNDPIPATLTVTFALPKVCHHVHPAAGRCGKVLVVPIGIWPEVMAKLGIERMVLDAPEVAACFPPRAVDAHKGSGGHVLAVGGSARYAGAIALSAHASLRTGAGLSTALSTEAARNAIHTLGPEVMLLPQPGDTLSPDALPALRDALPGKGALLVGPGLGQGEAQAAFLEGLLRSATIPLLLDADALNILATHPQLWELLPPGTVITPHPGEMRRLQPSPDPVTHRLEAAEALARSRNVIVVLKGPGTIIACPDGRSFVNPTGNPALATGGSGDVLSGVIAALLCRLEPGLAAAAGVYVHGLAGDLAAAAIGPHGVVASDILHHIPAAIRSLHPTPND